MKTQQELEAEKLAAEIAKLVAEADATREKAREEARKMSAETRELGKPFWHRPGFYAALLPALATAATIGWAVFGGTLKEYLAAQDIKAKAELQMIAAETKFLEYGKAKFAEQVAVLEGQRDALELERAQVAQAIADSQAKLETLQANLKRAPLDSLTKVLHQNSARSQSWSESNFENLAKAIKEHADPAEALAIVTQSMADIEALPVRAKLFYSFFVATGEQSYLEDLRGLIPEAIRQGTTEESFWSLFAGSYDAETGEAVEPKQWLAKSCGDVARAFAVFAGQPDPDNPSWRSDVISTFDGVTSGCKGIARQDGSALSADTVQIIASSAAALFDLDLGSYYSAQLAALIAPENPFAAKIIAVRAWSQNGFRLDTNYMVYNILDFGNLQPGETVDDDPAPEYWRAFFAQHGHIIDSLQDIPFEDWPTAPPN